MSTRGEANATSTAHLPPGRVKACTECRQQKQRCDAYLDFDSPCSRCKKFDLHCVVTTKFQRRKKRTKRELQREIDLLKTQIETGERPSLRQGSTANDDFTAPEDLDIQLEQPLQEYACGADTPRSPDTERLTASDRPINTYDDTVQSPTLSQSLMEVALSSKEIDDCFALFNKHYGPQLAGLFDLNVTPNKRFQQSPFLFWTIVCTASRRYTADPTIFTRLSQRLINFALSSLLLSARPIPAIQAVILLCTWPIPPSSIYHDPTHGLAGAALSLATQNGLHVLCKEVEFSKRPRKQSQEIFQLQGKMHEPSLALDVEIMFRLRLWTHCLVTLQRTSLLGGLPFPRFAGPTEAAPPAVLKGVLDPELYYRSQLHSIHTSAIIAITGSVKLESVDLANPDTLISLVAIYDMQLAEYDSEVHGVLETAAIAVWGARLSLRAFYFFLKPSATKLKLILETCIAACEFIERLWCQESQQTDFVLYMSHYMGRMVILAAFVLMRAMKSQHRDLFQRSRLQNAFGWATSMLKVYAVQPDDLNDVAGQMVKTLLESPRAFVQDDGKESALELKLRGRLFMSVVFDCFWWWRIEQGLPTAPEAPNSGDTHQQAALLSNIDPYNCPNLSSDDIAQLQDLQNRIYEPLLDNGFFSATFMDHSVLSG